MLRKNEQVDVGGERGAVRRRERGSEAKLGSDVHSLSPSSRTHKRISEMNIRPCTVRIALARPSPAARLPGARARAHLPADSTALQSEDLIGMQSANIHNLPENYTMCVRGSGRSRCSSSGWTPVASVCAC